MAVILESSHQEFKETMTEGLRALMEKADSMQEQMDNGSGEMESLSKNPKEMLKIKNTRSGKYWR